MDSEYLVDEILPAGEIHLVAGGSGDGKSTWLFQALTDWSAGKPLFGYTSHPCAYVYVSMDRSVKGIHRTLKRLTIDPGAPIIDARHGYPTLQKIVDAGRLLAPAMGLLVVEGWARLLKNYRSTDPYERTSEFLSDAGLLCEKEHITVIGTVHSPKTKHGEGYDNPRQRVLGSGAWGAWAETIILVERVKPDTPKDKQRKVTLLPRQVADEEFDYVLDSKGRFVLIDNVSVSKKLECLIESLPDELSTEQLMELIDGTGISKASLYRWLGENGKLVSCGRGKWRKIRPF